ncbi:MAG: methylated-DNA--[protein]-cysteine S-methyltransferase [bacterium]|nr:methylated-DNA--[protein]-cysteine S-methyltransferase [bacterium]
MNFQEKVYAIVAKIPKGKVVTYSQIAAMISTPRAARQVGMALSRLPQDSDIPWHRVINAQGFITIENLSVPKQEQARRLQKEGIKVVLKNGNYLVDLGRYLWKIPNHKHQITNKF